ncbi:hypothetical protein ACU4GD_31820 [Cupriavidus basilensis]
MIDVSSGAAVLANGKTQGGKGGDATLEANAVGPAHTGALTLDGRCAATAWTAAARCVCVRARSGSAKRGMRRNRARHAGARQRLLRQRLFGLRHRRQGWLDRGRRGPGRRDDAGVPLRRGCAAQPQQGGRCARAVDACAIPGRPVPGCHGAAQRREPELRAGAAQAAAADMATVQAVTGRGAVINVDPGQAIQVASIVN